MARIAVVGGGIAGLAAAYALQHGLQEGRAVGVTLIEAAPRLGGKILTERVGGFLIEGGPDSFLTLKPQAVQFARALGLGDRLVPTGRPRHVFILHRGRLHPLPDGLTSLVPRRLGPFLRSDLFSIREKARFAWDLLVPPNRNGSDETIGAFVRRRLGPAAVERLAGPLLAGIHAGDVEALSLRATFPTLAEAEIRYGSLTRAVVARRRSVTGVDGEAAMFMTLAGGLQELVDRVVTALQAVVLRTGTRALSLERRARGYRVILEGGEEVEADAVILATPANVAAALLRDVNEAASRLAADIPYASTAAVALGFRRPDVAHPLVGHGYVVASSEAMLHTACTWVSSKWPGRAPPDHVLLRCFVGRAGRSAGLELADDVLVRRLLAELAPLLGLRGDPVLARVYRWPASMPQYTVGHLERLRALRAALAGTPGLFMAGGGYEGVGLPDCIRQGQEAAAAALASASPP
ncbi:MAG: protoporphyrinogen oxidase [Armatimonadota bacterium]|nr:protoporphyrinogen oxidase [Armatimonadota bacterium]MDR7452344.1 protoporphyrinogen oxidase [Armatimonadota bacterium]MDR7466904.1 protoporphyrinogen oxidase [Armatimonadota bacterium]MDR7493554.1 protoporphyrinogen oxidase [Armatimonadota bacterium]MDR7498819.1 protoporphyrinogen oxidase [Armatimonadota bacterium]